jgi:hypothetical protein
MIRPDFKDFFPEGTTVQDIQKAFTGHPELYRYITALDAYVDWLEDQIGKDRSSEMIEYLVKIGFAEEGVFNSMWTIDTPFGKVFYKTPKVEDANPMVLKTHFGDLVINENKNLPSEGIVVKNESDNL